MDLSVIADLLDDFATFADNIRAFLEQPVKIVQALTEANYGELAGETVGAFGSSAADNADAAN